MTLFSDAELQQMRAHCRDLSEAGIGVLVAVELNPGEVVSMEFTLPGTAEAWQIRAVLRHRRGYHYGFEFLSVSDEQRVTLTRYFSGLDRADSE